MLIASWMAFIGFGSPTLPSTLPPAASSSSGTASARTSRAASSGWSSGSIALARPPTTFGTSSVNVAPPRAARSRTASMSAGGAAVLCATMRTRVAAIGAVFHAPPSPAFRRDDERSDRMDFRLELIAVPVSDVDRAKTFYTEQAGFHADHDHRVSDEIRFVQLTPPGSACSIAIGHGTVESEPGSLEGLQPVVSDIEVARDELAGRGVEVDHIQAFPWGWFVFFADPD